MRPISRSDIEGCRIIRIDSTSRIDDGYSVSVCYFTTNRGLTFTLPEHGSVFFPATVPGDASEMPDVFEEPIFLVKRHWFWGTKFVRRQGKKIDIVKCIKDRVVVGIYCPPLDNDLGFYPPDSSFILFDDGTRAICVTAAPTGTSSSGLYYVDQEFDDWPEIIDFFDIPLVESEPE